MYHVTGTIVVASLLYLLSLFFYSTGYYSQLLHRKIWNTILAAAFFFTALAGIFLALQVNYKWNLPAAKEILKWHVEAGIALAVSGLFHFSWHFPYFSGLFRRAESREKTKSTASQGNQAVNLFIVGFVSSSVQLLLLREIMNITGGYELISGTFLGSWLIISAAGSALAGKSDISDLRKINLIFSTGPIFSLLFLLILSRLFTITGQTPSFLAGFIYTFIVLLPFCLISGFTFVKLIRFSEFSSGKSFSVETTGGIVAGLSIPLFTAGFLNTYQLLLLIIILVNTYVMNKYVFQGKRIVTFIKVIAAVLSSAIIIFNADVLFRQILLPGLRVVSTHDTPYGNITTTEYATERSIYYNHSLLSYASDVVEREENVHYAMLQSNKPVRVVLFSGSLSSHLEEILKYNVSEIVYIERDPVLAKIDNTDRINTSVKITVSGKDAFKAVREIEGSADVILMLIPPPSTLMLNRYYTTEFFTESKKKLGPGGVFMCSPGNAANYYNKESLRLYSSIYNSLKATFGNVLPVSGNKLYFIASDEPLTSSFTKLAGLRNIRNIYVSADYLSDDLTESKTKELLSLLDTAARQNTADRPTATFTHQALIFSKDPGEKIPSIAVLLIIFAFPAMTIGRRNMMMYASASALAGFEIIQLLTMQLVAGSMYQHTGLLLAGFMAGLAAGSGIDFKWIGSLSLKMKALILAMFFLITGIIYDFIESRGNIFISIVILIILAFIPAFLTGNIFRDLTGRSKEAKNISGIYSADLSGSAIGFIVVASLSVPLAGIRMSVFILSLIILTGFVFGLTETSE